MKGFWKEIRNSMPMTATGDLSLYSYMKSTRLSFVLKSLKKELLKVLKIIKNSPEFYRRTEEPLY